MTTCWSTIAVAVLAAPPPTDPDTVAIRSGSTCLNQNGAVSWLAATVTLDADSIQLPVLVRSTVTGENAGISSTALSIAEPPSPGALATAGLIAANSGTS